MNIFVLDDDPKNAAKFHSNRHCIKMILETAQILCTAFSKGEAPYKQTHYNHPCCIWARESRENYLWLIELGKALAAEYTHRYEKTHKSLSVILWCEEHMNEIEFPQEEMTPFAQAMPDDYIHPDPVIAYRDYYKKEKSHLFAWKNREKPFWI